MTETDLAGIDGYRLCELLRAERDTKAVPIVVLTSEMRADYHQRARQAGADAVLTKPCLPEVLFTTMQSVRKEARALRGRSSTRRDAASAFKAPAVDTWAIRESRELECRRAK